MRHFDWKFPILFFPFATWNAHCWAVVHFYFPGWEKLFIFVQLYWSLLHCSQFTSHVKQHPCLIQWRQNSCNASGPSLCLPHFGSHLSRRLEPICTIVGSLGSRSCWGPKGAGKQCVGEYCEHEKKQCDLHDTVDMFLVRRRRLA